MPMRAERGDWLIIERAGVGQSPRTGRIVAVPSGDGSPPYRVLWAGSGHISLMFPGPDARLVRAGEVNGSAAARLKGSVRPAGRSERFWRWLLRDRKA